ncbi:30720_t:CDS:2, partial [Racocetra persica]
MATKMLKHSTKSQAPTNQNSPHQPTTNNTSDTTCEMNGKDNNNMHSRTQIKLEKCIRGLAALVVVYDHTQYFGKQRLAFRTFTNWELM